MIFRQLYDNDSSTYTYLLADENTRRAVLIDPVFENAKRDLALIDELGLTLDIVLETHAHADHITSAWLLKQKTGCRIGSAAVIGAQHVDLPLSHGDVITVSSIALKVLATPGHTNGCISYVMEDQSMVFTGDALLIRGCGRSDFQEGSAETLYHSITSVLFALPDTCLVFPAHDYNGRLQSSIGEERAFNTRAGGGASERDFVEFMNAMKLPHPRKIDEAVPANLRSGCPEDGVIEPDANWSEARYTYAGVPEVDRIWLEEHVGEVTLLDVRLKDELEPPAELHCDLHIPLDELDERADEVSDERPVVAFCRSGRRSALAAKILMDKGHKKVASLKGGLLVL
jgi:glyoxylase-like metal-dependent hydrolase (beta-lactamase superfamily II)/rhodanese-related sulfurtransferase